MPRFEEQYVALRQKENRLLSDEQVSKLPFYSGNEQQEMEWKFRRETFNRFVNYLKKNKPSSVLEIGCGNGWFAAGLAALSDIQVTAIDVNQLELDQAIRVFGNCNPVFVNADIFTINFDGKKFDRIVLNASIQYFPQLTILISRLRELLNENGEIHVLDSPFYDLEDLHAAKKRSSKYYAQSGFPEMTNYYFHHSAKEIIDAGGVYLHKPLSGFLGKIIRRSPFPWLKLKKQ